MNYKCHSDLMVDVLNKLPVIKILILKNMVEIANMSQMLNVLLK